MRLVLTGEKLLRQEKATKLQAAHHRTSAVLLRPWWFLCQFVSLVVLIWPATLFTGERNEDGIKGRRRRAVGEQREKEFVLLYF